MVNGPSATDVELLRNKLLLYEALLDAVPNPIFVKSEDAHFSFFNKAYEQFFGMKREDRLGKSVLDLDYIPLEDRERYQKEDLDAINRGLEVHYDTEYDTPTGKRDALYWSKGIAVPATGEKALIGQLVDITHLRTLEKELEQKVDALRHSEESLAAKVAELEAAQSELNRLCRIDPLTGLANRMCFHEQMIESMDFAERYDLPFSIIMGDIDHFKSVNDTYGHEMGDDVLKAFGKLLHDTCRRGDMAARYGGEEFIVILPMAKLEAALMVAERIRAGMEKLSLLPDGAIVTVSLGAAEFRAGEDMKDFIKRADDALYKAKETGRNKVCS